jgi:hypothetical protein
MANNTYAYGFRWYSNINGGDMPKPYPVRVASGYAAAPGGTSVALRPGDLVKDTAAGGCELAVAGDAILGVVTAVLPYYDPAVGEMVIADNLPATIPAYGSNFDRESRVMVLPANGVVFQAMCDDASTATTYAAYRALIGFNVDMINVPVTGYAHPLLDISESGTATRQFRIVDVPLRPDVDYSGLYVPLLVTLNEGRLPPFSATGI